ncbi:hypothetical protein FF1_014832 [Malus domestica]
MKGEIERQRYEKALMEERYEFEWLEKLKAEEELRVKLSLMARTEAVNGQAFPFGAWDEHAKKKMQPFGCCNRW